MPKILEDFALTVVCLLSDHAILHCQVDPYRLVTLLEDCRGEACEVSEPLGI